MTCGLVDQLRSYVWLNFCQISLLQPFPSFVWKEVLHDQASRSSKLVMSLAKLNLNYYFSCRACVVLVSASLSTSKLSTVYIWMCTWYQVYTYVFCPMILSPNNKYRYRYRFAVKLESPFGVSTAVCFSYLVQKMYRLWYISRIQTTIQTDLKWSIFYTSIVLSFYICSM